MPQAIGPAIPPRFFLGSLLFAAGSGCDGRFGTEKTKVAENRRPEAEVIATKSAGVQRLADSGMRRKQFDEVLRLVTQPAGMFLCCGPADAGLTTALYACLQEIDPRKKKIMTVEDPIESHLDNITQRQINTKKGGTFADSLRWILRQDPDVIMIGELRDKETASIACEAATTGHMVFSSIRTNDTVTALFRLLDLGVEPSLLASALTALLGKRLVRLLCENCKEAYEPKPEFLEKANLPADRIDFFYRRPVNPQRVCPQCNGTGYIGWSGIFEMLVFTDVMRGMLREDPSVLAIKAEARKHGMIYIQEDGLRLVIQGKTSISELLRVLTSGVDDRPASPSGRLEP